MKWVRRVLGALAVVAAVGLLADRLLHLPSPPPTAAELESLTRQRDELTLRLREAVAKAGEQSLARAPKAGIMVGIPVGFTRSVVNQVVTGLFGETTLTLRNLKVHHEGDVKVKLLVAKRRVGQFVLDVLIHEVRGLLKPSAPSVDFAKDRINLALPVALAEGSGSAQIRFQWDSKGLAANMICGDADITREVTGTVRPEDYKAAGSFGLATDGRAITLQPDFGELAMRIFVVPTEQAWQVVDGVVAEQKGGCRDALQKIDIKKILSKLLDKGFNVKIPKKIFKPIRLPAGVEQSLDLQGVKLGLTVRSTGLLVSDDRLWYGANLQARRVSSPPAAAHAAAKRGSP